MKKIVAINCSPRVNMNTGTLVREAAKGAKAEGAEVQVFDLYRLDKVHGCMSCFACKLAPNEGKCVFKDGLAPVLEAIREADGLVIYKPPVEADTFLLPVTEGYEATAKTKSSFRSFPLSQTQIDYLQHRKALQDRWKAVKPWYDRKWDGFVCVKPDGDLIYPDYVTRAFPKLCEKVGLKRLKLHELRHTNISLLLDDGATMKELQEWAGHSSYATTANIYAHLTAKSKDKLSASIDRILG